MKPMTRVSEINEEGNVVVPVGRESAGQSVTVTIVPNKAGVMMNNSDRERAEKAIRETFGAIPDLIEIEDRLPEAPTIIDVPQG